MKKLFVLVVGFLTVFLYSCGGDERDNSIEASCRIYCEKQTDCFDDRDEEDCTDSCVKDWQNQIDSEKVSDSEECKDAFADWAECMDSLVCDDYRNEGNNCGEEYECQCDDELAFMNSVCPVK